jgi:5-methylcytosine-specific restriction endonuclease McrA
MADKKRPSNIHRRLLCVLRQHSEGINITDIRRELRLSATDQQHLDKRLRELYPYYRILRERRGGKTVYILTGRARGGSPAKPVDKTTRARILHMAGYRCQMCGRTPAEDKVKLHVDHKIPRDWGGSSDDDNLWAVCQECNEGKKNFFASITDERVRSAIVHESVHIRIGELLKAFAGNEVPKEYIQIVAYTHDDYEKRMRELRELGWSYHYKKRKVGKRIRTSFILDKWEPWPDDPAAEIKAAESRKGLRRGGVKRQRQTSIGGASGKS